MNPERSVWAVADGVATLFMGAATTAWGRMLARRDTTHTTIPL